jgi:protein-tyrosine phosphatase
MPPAEHDDGRATNDLVIPRLLVVCTGNAARSVIAGVVMGTVAGSSGTRVEVETAGTHAVDGQPISSRTRDALALIGLSAPEPAHRSSQLDEPSLQAADLVVVMEPDHVRYVRSRHPQAAPRTATLPYLAMHLDPSTLPLTSRVARLRLAELDPGIEGEVADPAGQDEAAYAACAREIQVLASELMHRLLGR